MTRSFPDGFRWGAATSAFQIEGASASDGRGLSIWDTFAALPDTIERGETGEPACDHYRRYPEDVALMQALNLSAYRFSVAWPRIQPTGSGAVEPRGLGFYDRLVDTLLAAGIEPFPTLYHWDLPQALQDIGGWTSRDTALRFADYAAVVHERLGDRVRRWTTINEPWCIAYLGHHAGIHAPGLRDPMLALQALHHVLLGHGLAVRRLREQNPDNLLSIALNFTPVRSDSAEASRRVDGISNRMFLDPVLGKGYPQDIVNDLTWLGDWRSVVLDGDLDIIGTPLDWLGLNYYTPLRATDSADPASVTPWILPGLRGVDIGAPQGPTTEMGWEQEPAGLTELLLRVSSDSGLPVYVTENGSAFPDDVTADGRINDHDRTRYLTEHLASVHAALDAGADVRGYFAWSLLDNFEWAAGYRPRFGLVHVDYPTQRRTIKLSGHTYAAVAASGALPH